MNVKTRLAAGVWPTTLNHNETAASTESKGAGMSVCATGGENEMKICEYALATGSDAVGRLMLLHKIYSPAGRRVLLEAGLRPGMRIADFGCGVGAATRMLAEMAGPGGRVTGIDIYGAQLEEARKTCARAGFVNTTFVKADACATGLPRESFDLVYCRFLLLHLPDPAACLREMRGVLKPGGVLVVEDGELGSATSIPATDLKAFAELFSLLGPRRGLNYSLARNLFHLVKAADFSDPAISIHQPAAANGEIGLFLKWSVEEAGPAFVSEGLISDFQLRRRLHSMQMAAEDRGVLALAPQMSQVWARKEMSSRVDVPVTGGAASDWNAGNGVS
jgi:SAM-dependent methyltransferase